MLVSFSTFSTVTPVFPRFAGIPRDSRALHSHNPFANYLQVEDKTTDRVRVASQQLFEFDGTRPVPIAFDRIWRDCNCISHYSWNVPLHLIKCARRRHRRFVAAITCDVSHIRTHTHACSHGRHRVEAVLIELSSGLYFLLHADTHARVHIFCIKRQITKVGTWHGKSHAKGTHTYTLTNTYTHTPAPGNCVKHARVPFQVCVCVCAYAYVLLVGMPADLDLGAVWNLMMLNNRLAPGIEVSLV